MEEILPGVFDWSAFHERIRGIVGSHFLARSTGRVLIDARVPPEGVEWFRSRPWPTDILLTNRHHYRHSGEFRREFGCLVWCHEDGLHEFTSGEEVRGFRFGDELPGGVQAVEVASLCPDETALYVPWAGAIALADGVIREGYDGPLAFVPDFLMGEDPAGVKDGLLAAFENLLELDFHTLLLAHGAPVVRNGKEALAEFVERSRA